MRAVLHSRWLRPVRRRIKQLAYLSRWIPLGPLTSGGRIVVFYFHRALPDATPKDNWRRLIGHPTISDLRTKFRYLERHFEIISVSRCLQILAHGRPLDRNYAVLTVDDGYRDFRTALLCLLEEMEIPAALFLCPEAVERGTLWFQLIYDLVDRVEGDRLYVPWVDRYIPFDQTAARIAAVENDVIPYLDGLTRQVREERMASLFDANWIIPGLAAADPFCSVEDLIALSGSPRVELYPHGHAHQNFKTMSDDELRADVRGCQEFFRYAFGAEPRVISYPRGGYRPAQWPHLAALGVEFAFTAQEGCEWPGRHSPLALHRVGLDGLVAEPMADFHWRILRLLAERPSLPVPGGH